MKLPARAAGFRASPGFPSVLDFVLENSLILFRVMIAVYAASRRLHGPGPDSPAQPLPPSEVQKRPHFRHRLTLFPVATPELVETPFQLINHINRPNLSSGGF